MFYVLSRFSPSFTIFLWKSTDCQDQPTLHHAQLNSNSLVTSFKASSWEDRHSAQHASGDLLQGIFLRGWTQRSTCKEPCGIVHFHLFKTFRKNWPCLITIKHVWTNVGRDSGYWAVQLQVQSWVLGYLNLRLRNLLTLDLDPDHEIVSCWNWNSNLDQPVIPFKTCSNSLPLEMQNFQKL